MKSLKQLFGNIFGKKKVSTEPTLTPTPPPEPVKPAPIWNQDDYVDDPLIQMLDRAIEDGKRMQTAVEGQISAEEATAILGKFTHQMSQVSAMIQIDQADSDKAAGRITEAEHASRVDDQLDRYNRPPLF